MGKVLFVPVDIGISGTVPQVFATARLVPSRPKVVMQQTDLSASIAAARVVSSWVNGRIDLEVQVYAILGALSEVVRLRHDPHLVDADCIQPQEHPADDVHLLLVVEHGAVGHQPADVPARCGICDDSLRQTEGFVASLIVLMDLSLKTPDHNIAMSRNRITQAQCDVKREEPCTNAPHRCKKRKSASVVPKF